MGELASVEKLRAYGSRVRIDHDGDYLDLWKACDEIQAEVDSRYFELPVDADGVPIRIGDTVREVDDRVPMEVMSLTFYEDCVDVNACGMNPNLLRHVKPRTVEDVLVEFYGEFAKASYGEDGEVLSHYADELRGMMETDDD